MASEREGTASVILSAFELAENELDPERQRAFLTFVVVGAGPTGVELAGAIADISRTALRGDFRRIDPAQARVVLVEAGPRVLASFSELLSERAKRDLVERHPPWNEANHPPDPNAKARDLPPKLVPVFGHVPMSCCRNHGSAQMHRQGTRLLARGLMTQAIVEDKEKSKH